MTMLKSRCLLVKTLPQSHSHTLSLLQSLIHSLSTCSTFVFMSRLQGCKDLQTCTLSVTHSKHAKQLLFSCVGCKVDMACKFALSHSLTLDMLNNFCFHVYAQKSLSHSLTVTLSLSLSLFLTLTLFQSLIQSLSTC